MSKIIPIQYIKEDGYPAYWFLEKNTCDEISKNQSMLKLIQPSRLYVNYGDNTIPTQLTQNEWKRFEYPSTGYTVYRQHNFLINETISRFTYIGTQTLWFDISTTCNVTKASGGNNDQTINLRWYLNGSPIGYSRAVDITNQNEAILTGNGQLFLSEGDYIEPWICNIDGNDDVLLTNCCFNIRADPDLVWGCFNCHDNIDSNITASRSTLYDDTEEPSNPRRRHSFPLSDKRRPSILKTIPRKTSIDINSVKFDIDEFNPDE